MIDETPPTGEAIDRLVAIGDREKELLTGETMHRIASAAARERRGSLEPIPIGRVPIDDRLPLAETPGLKGRPRHLRPVLALAAAILVAAVAGVGLLSEPEQLVVTQEGASQGQRLPAPNSTIDGADGPGAS